MFEISEGAVFEICERGCLRFVKGGVFEICEMRGV